MAAPKIFDATAIGSPVTAAQLAFLAEEALRIARQMPSTSTVTYIGSQGALTTNYKNTSEYNYSAAIPVPSVAADCAATCNVVIPPLLFSSANELSLTRQELSWIILCRSTADAIGSYQTDQRPTLWANILDQQPIGGIADVVSFPVTLAASVAGSVCGALLAFRLLGTWGYSGNLPGYVAFCTFEG